MVKKKKAVKKRNIPRPYNNWKLSESELRSKILAKLRQFTQYWNPAKTIKAKTKECAHCWIQKWPFDSDHINSVVPVDWWEKTDDLFLWYNWNEWLRNALVEEDWFQWLCWNCHKFKSKSENEARRKNKALKKALKKQSGSSDN